MVLALIVINSVIIALAGAVVEGVRILREKA